MTHLKGRLTWDNVGMENLYPHDHDPALLRWIKQLPKAELHLHIEGSFEPELMFEIAQRNHIQLPYHNVDEIREAYEFSDLQSFLDIYYAGASVLITEQDFFDLTWAYLERAAEDGVVHTEIFFDPQTHTSRGVSMAIVVNGIDRALAQAQKRWGLSSKLIMCFLRHLDEASAFETLDEAKPFLDKIHGVGLDSSELGHPPEKFAKVFEASRALGLFTVAHAGEEGPPAYVWGALDTLKVVRIDHGVRSIEDDALMARLIKEQIALTVCPLSNLKLCVVDDLSGHNLATMLKRGVNVTINSDDPAYFGGYIAENFYQTALALQLTREDIKQICANSIRSSVIAQETKQLYLERLA
jgi:adenine deaminase